jgi:thiamine pyrophosphate-dependent acetolactate synthase large subunit-like protein
MSVPSGRDRVASEVERLMRRAAFHLAPEPGDVPALVDLLIDVVKAEIRADASPGPTPRPECKPVVGGRVFVAVRRLRPPLGRGRLVLR